MAFLFFTPAVAGASAVDVIVRRIFPEGISIQEKTLWLNEIGKKAIRESVGIPFDADHLPYVAVSDTSGVIGYAFVDEVKGLHEMITYLTALNADGRIRAVEVLVYREAYGYEIKYERFRNQFAGKMLADPLRVGAGIRNIAGATISTNAITAGVRKILVIYEVAIKNLREKPKEAGRRPAETPIRRTRILWGTALTIEIADTHAEDVETVIGEAFADVERLTSIFNRYDTSSEISRINFDGVDRPSTGGSAEFEQLLKLAMEMKNRTRGLFDPAWRRRDPAELDLDGIAKGYAVDRIVVLFKRNGVDRALINFGESSIAALGAPNGKAGWEIVVRDARHPKSVEEVRLTTLVVRDAVLSVSGSYERGRHIVNPFTGKPPPDSIEAVVVGPISPDAAARADALSTAIFAGGDKALEDAEGCGFEGLWLGPKGAVRTKHFTDYEKAK